MIDSELKKFKTYAICDESFHIFNELRWSTGDIGYSDIDLYIVMWACIL